MVKIVKEPLVAKCRKCGKDYHYRAWGVSTGKDPVTGKRTQRTITGCTKGAVEAEIRRIGVQVDEGTYSTPWNGTVPELIDSYLAWKAGSWELNTQASYKHALESAREFFRYYKSRAVTREDVQRFREHELARGRRRGGVPGTGLSARSVNLTLGQLQAAYSLAGKDRKVAVNPVLFVDRVPGDSRDHGTWTEEEVRRFLATAASDRLAAAWLLSMLGLRRAEVLGLRWTDISRDARTLTIRRTWVLVESKPVEKGPKSKRSARTLPMLDVLAAALDKLEAVQFGELEAAGPAYANSGFVVLDELGQPFGIERYSDEFHRIAKEAGLPRIRLHDTRATMNSILEKLGVPETIRAAWFGHTIAVNRGSYLGAPELDELRPAGTVMSRVLTGE